MNYPTSSAAQPAHVPSRVSKMGSLFSRIHRSLLAGLGIAGVFLISAPALAAVAPNLGYAYDYSILAGTQVTNTGPTTISGDVGISPASGAVGANHPGLTAGMVGGTIHDKDVPAQNAQSDQAAAYTWLGNNNACTTTYAGTKDLVGLNLVPGVYCANAFQLSGTLTLNGTASDIWVFKSASSLIITGTANVITPSCSVWWRAVSSASFDPGSSLAGNILADTSITMAAGATLSGKAFARTAEVTLSSNTISACAIPADTAPSSLGMIKTVNNTGGGTATADQFTLTASGPRTISGPGPVVAAVVAPAGVYTLTETGPTGYTAGYSCSGGGALAGNLLTITAGADSTITCTITNTFSGAVPAVTAIPTLSEWAMIVLATLLAIVGFVAMRRKER